MKAIAKAIIAGISGGIAFAIPAVSDGLTTGEWLGIIGAAVATFYVTWLTPNTPIP